MGEGVPGLDPARELVLHHASGLQSQLNFDIPILDCLLLKNRDLSYAEHHPCKGK